MSFEKRLLTSVMYENKFPLGTIRYSASMRGADPVQNALRLSFPEGDQTHVGMNTIGSIFHAGMEALVNKRLLKFDGNAITEHFMISNEEIDSASCVLHGTADLVLSGNEPIEPEFPSLNVERGKTIEIIEYIQIIDYKLTSSYQMKMLKEKKDEMSSRYLPQLQMLLYLKLANIIDDKDIDENMPLHITLSDVFFVRDAMFSKKQKVFEKVDWVDEVLTIRELRDALIDIREEIFNEVREILSVVANDGIKDGCKDRWIRKIDGVTVPTKCVWYCSVKDSCPFFKTEVPPISKRVADPGLWS
jgi:hypothetical protein